MFSIELGLIIFKWKHKNLSHYFWDWKVQQWFTSLKKRKQRAGGTYKLPTFNSWGKKKKEAGKQIIKLSVIIGKTVRRKIEANMNL